MSFGAERRGKPFGGTELFQIDHRIGEDDIWVLGGRKLTLIPDEIRKCVAFVCVKNASGITPVGTTFFVGIPVSSLGFPIAIKGNRTLSFTLAITAKHVIDGIKEFSVDGSCYLRVNLREGATQLIRTDIRDWVFHPNDPSVDVAAIVVSLPQEESDKIDHLMLAPSMFATKEIIEREGIGIGDGVFFTGLFSAYSGARKNIPLVRVGNIAAMPEEPVNLHGFGDAQAYLVEARSIGGLSGSPVFVYLGIIKANAEGKPIFSTSDNPPSATSGHFYLLGLMHGHWDTESQDDILLVRDLKGEAVNMGIAIVVPATNILEVINQPKLQEGMRAVLERMKEKGNLPVPDST